MSKDQTYEHTNKLIDQNSPYLLQHAHNPVDWYPWGEEALEKAKKEDKMLIISVGYSACHWCHVMEHESFEDSMVAAVMNEHFVSIKVDREERPDVDDVYMTACQLASGRGCGWPLNAFALPDGRPVWAGTYFPREQWMDILKQFSKMYQDERQKLEEYASQITQGIQNQDQIKVGEPTPLYKEDAIKTAKAMIDAVDIKKGGRQGAPKFPMPNNYEYLLTYHKMTGNEKALEAVVTTLDNMSRGGIYDQLGGGFARYSVDSDWLVPHFEKMLYDNGQLVSLYSKAFQLTGDSSFLEVIDQTIDFVFRELTSTEGGFYSSLDADSEGEEGKFYVWTKQELDDLLNQEEQKIVYNYYNIEGRGNWEDGKNILHVKNSLAEVAGRENLDYNKARETLQVAEKKLFEERGKRVRPGLDDKILTAWNALMLKGLTDAYKATGKDKYKDGALRNANFLKDNMIKSDHSLYRNYKDGSVKINGFLDDYALLIQAFINVYEITFDELWLKEAVELAEVVIENFYNSEKSMFHYTSKTDDPLIARKMEITDNVIPGSNSSMARSLHYLYHFFYDEQYKKISDQMLYNVVPVLVKSGQTSFYSNWALLYLEKLYETYEIAIVGEEAEAKRNELQQNFLPNAIWLGGKEEGSLELLEGKYDANTTRIFVCQNRVCQLPVIEPEEALKQIEY